MIDSAISHFHRPGERELERWTPDEDDSEFIELEKYDKKWNRSWDQFETNAALFGVKSTFNEEIYTTKLERGPHMRELEKQATKIAREIENEVTEDIHLAEERGLDLDEDLDQDEEIKYSAVRRDVDGSSFNLPAHAPSTTRAFESFTRTGNNEHDKLTACSSVDKEPSPHVLYTIISTNDASQLTSEHQSHKVLPLDEESRLDEKMTKDGSGGKDNENVQSEKSLSEGSKPSMSEENVTTSLTGNSTSSASERVAANSVSSTPGLSPSSSMGSLSSDKSSLNPNAKEFKFNPNAKSFTPSSPLRPPQPPASDGSFYYPNNVPTVPLGPGLPMGTGFPSAFGGQPVVYNAQPGQWQSPQSYIHPGGPPYGQQMMLGQGHPVYYYAPEMQQYRGRGF